MRVLISHPRFNWSIAAGVAIVHAAVLPGLLASPVGAEGRLAIPEDSPVVMAAFIAAERRAYDRVPIPEVILESPHVNLNSIRLIQFESEDWGDISAVVASSSAPQLSRFQPVDAAAFARRAGLAPGQVASVVLTVEVLPDGTVGSVEVARGFGDPVVDAAAIAYGRLLRWIPGTRDHRAETMRVSLPVTLVWSV
jgi:TonB family protein